MNTETQTASQQTATPTAPTDLGELSFTDYVKVRKGGEMPAHAVKTESALADKPAEQKKTGESDTSETAEEIDEKEGDSEESGDESDSKEAKEDEATDRPKKKSGLERRFKKLTSEREQARQEAEHWKREALKYQSATESKEKTTESRTVQATTDDPEPKPEDFETHTEFVKATARWEIRQERKAAEAEAAKKQLQTEQQKLVQSYQEKVKSFAEKTEDYTDVIESVDDIPVSPAVHQLILESDLGPELTYELAKNRAEFERINKLSPLAAAREMGKIEARLNASVADKTKPEPKTLTQAPKPLATVGKGPAKVSKDINDPNLSFSEYERIRREQMKRRR